MSDIPASVQNEIKTQSLSNIAADIENSAKDAMSQKNSWNTPQAQHLWDVLGLLSSDTQKFNGVVSILLSDSARNATQSQISDNYDMPQVEIVHENDDLAKPKSDASATANGAAASSSVEINTGDKTRTPSNPVVEISFLKYSNGYEVKDTLHWSR